VFSFQAIEATILNKDVARIDEEEKSQETNHLIQAVNTLNERVLREGSLSQIDNVGILDEDKMFVISTEGISWFSGTSPSGRIQFSKNLEGWWLNRNHPHAKALMFLDDYLRLNGITTEKTLERLQLISYGDTEELVLKTIFKMGKVNDRKLGARPPLRKLTSIVSNTLQQILKMESNQLSNALDRNNRQSKPGKVKQIEGNRIIVSLFKPDMLLDIQMARTRLAKAAILLHLQSLIEG